MTADHGKFAKNRDNAEATPALFSGSHVTSLSAPPAPLDYQDHCVECGNRGFPLFSVVVIDVSLEFDNKSNIFSTR